MTGSYLHRQFIFCSCIFLTLYVDGLPGSLFVYMVLGIAYTRNVEEGKTVTQYVLSRSCLVLHCTYTEALCSMMTTPTLREHYNAVKPIDTTENTDMDIQRLEETLNKR